MTTPDLTSPLRRRRLARTAPSPFTTRVRTVTTVRSLVIGFTTLLVVWQLASMVVARTFAVPEQVLPSIPDILGEFKGLSDYWKGGLGLKAVQDGGDQTYRGAVLALAYGAWTTTLRMLAGFTLACIVGIALGIVIGLSARLRRLSLGPLALLAALPLLAMLPLFSFWFGATTKAAIWFVFYGTVVTVVRATVNAVDNVPRRYTDQARTLGATRLQLFRRVLLPAILPELRAGLTLALTFAWSMVLGAELLGVQGGLGAMMSQAIEFSALGRMVFISGVFIILAAASVTAFSRLTGRLLRWMA
ncbi:MAG: ABC transporter permease subunit [Solirubrobacteraceae bacterium]|nr:ABC transporter permease subunit [Solirubrobacteraceae bacterium]